MLEVIIDRWSKAGRTDYLWSVWDDGRRIHQGDAHRTEAEARETAVRFCRAELDREPDRITEL